MRNFLGPRAPNRGQNINNIAPESRESFGISQCSLRSQLTLSWILAVNNGGSDLESGIAETIVRCERERTPWSILGGGCLIRSSHTALAGSSRCGASSALAMRRSMTSMARVFSPGCWVNLGAQYGTCAVLFECIAVMLCVRASLCILNGFQY